MKTNIFEKKFHSLKNYALLCSQKIIKSYIIMNKSLKMLGLAIIVLAAIVLILSYFLGWTNNNAVQAGSFAAMVVGLIIYIIFGKKQLGEQN